MKSTLVKQLSIVFVTAFFLLGASNTYSQESLPLQISPTRQEIEVEPGETVSIDVQFFNFGESPTSGLLKAADFIVDNNNGAPRIIEDANQASPRFSATQWVTLPYDRMSIAADDKVTVNARISVPANARPGGRYISLYYEPSTSGLEFGATEREAGSSVSPRIGSLVFIKVKGPITEKALVSRLFASAFQEYGPIKVEADILNRGDYHIRPRGSMTLMNMFDGSVDQAKLDEVNIFPDAARTYEQELGQKWMIGRYSIDVKAAYGEGGQVIERSIWVWVFPWRIALVILLALIIIWMIGKYLYKNIIQRERRLEEQLRNEHEHVEKLRDELHKKNE